MAGWGARRLVAAAALLACCGSRSSGEAGAEDPLPTVSVNSTSAPEGGAVPVRITLSAAADSRVTVKATTSGGSGLHGPRRDGHDRGRSDDGGLRRARRPRTISTSPTAVHGHALEPRWRDARHRYGHRDDHRRRRDADACDQRAGPIRGRGQRQLTYRRDHGQVGRHRHGQLRDANGTATAGHGLHARQRPALSWPRATRATSRSSSRSRKTRSTSSTRPSPSTSLARAARTSRPPPRRRRSLTTRIPKSRSHAITDATVTEGNTGDGGRDDHGHPFWAEREDR